MICSSRFGPPRALVNAMLDAGAKAVICPVREAPASHWSGGDGEEDPERDGRERGGEDGVEEGGEDLTEFLGKVYEGLFSRGGDAVTALQHALQAHPRQHYKCHVAP